MSQQPLAATDRFGLPDSSGGSGAAQPAPRVLVVDDDPGMRLLMDETLANAGFNVACAESGLEAIETCPEFMPDLILLDINMPQMDGITACAELRRCYQIRIPIIMVTSVDDALSIQRAFDAGATDFILKPLNWPLFQRRLDSVLASWNRSQKLNESTKRVSLLEKVAPDQVMIVSRRGEIIEDLKEGSDSSSIIPRPHYQNIEEIYGAEIAQRFKQQISGVLKTARQKSLTFKYTEYGMMRDCEAQFMADGRERVMVVVQDITSETESQSEIYDLAFFDPATSLPNHHLFNRCADELLIDAGLHDRSLVLVNFCFDNISADDIADRSTMLSVADRMRESLSGCLGPLQIGTDEHSAAFARFDINRFVMLLDIRDGSDDLEQMCDRIVQGYSEHLVSDTGSHLVSPRLGAATYPADGRNLQTLMHAAGAAMHEAVETGQFICFNAQGAATPEFDTQDYGEELSQAMEEGQLELFFQPRLSIADGSITSVEALLRWNHPIRGFVSIDELLHLAKATGLIVPLGDWVLRTACQFVRNSDSATVPGVSINLSQQEFVRQDLAARLKSILDEFELDADRIELEFTEAVLLRAENSRAELRRLKDLGVGLVLDNFGTGHTSLALLKRSPIDALKIDRSFVRELPGSDEDAAVCEIVITLAHKLGMKVIAEGVETEQQLAFLRQQGCDEYQGFHFCEPLPAARIMDFLVGLE